MSQDSFLMKNRLKSEVFGTREQCTGALFKRENSNVALKEKKKRDFKTQTRKTPNPNRTLIYR